MLTLLSVGRGSGGGSDLSTGVVAAISAGIFVAIVLTVFCISAICFLCKLLIEVIKKRFISLPNADVPLAYLCWRDRRQKNEPWKIKELEVSL